MNPHVMQKKKLPSARAEQFTPPSRLILIRLQPPSRHVPIPRRYFFREAAEVVAVLWE